MEAQKAEFVGYCETVEACQEAVNAVRAALADAPHGDASAHADWNVENLIPAMNALRESCDALERRTEEDLWPFPSYHQMLFQF
jgi:glutamine synthetase